MSDFIDRQAAIDAVREELEDGTYFDIPSKIESLPSAQPEPCNDLISREMALDEIHKCLETRDYTLGSLYDAFCEMPSAQPERKTGKWVGYNADNEKWLRDDGSPIFLTCSDCDHTVLNNGSAYWHYCPNCGCKMEVQDES